MPSTYSNLKFQLMATGENAGTWGNVTNLNLGTAVEEAIVGSTNVSFSSADVTLSLADSNSSQPARNLRLNLTGTSGGARNLIVPTIEKVYIINNGLADAVTVKNATGTGIAVPAGKTMYVYNDGTNVVDAVTHLSSLTTGVLTSTSTTTLNGTTIPASKTLVTTVDTQTLTNKTINLASNTLQATSAQIAAAVTDETGTGALVFANSPTLVTPALGTPASGVVTNLTGTASININGTVGATTPSTGAFTNLSYTGTLTGSTGILNIGSGQIYKDASGNVGVGTSSPLAKLSIGNQILIEDANSFLTSSNAVLIARTSGAGSGVFSEAGHLVLQPRSTASRAIIFSNGNPGTEAMRIVSGGNVGIGTSAPAARLGVTGANTAMGSDGLVRFGADANGADIGAQITFGNDTARRAAIAGRQEGASGAAGYLQFGTRGTSGDITERMRITAAGNVGIGTTAPSNILHVAGSASGTLLDNNTNKSFSTFNATNSSADAWNAAGNYTISARSNNNALAFLVGGTQNDRAAGIQVGHENSTFASFLGTLALNPFGGNVGIGTTAPLAKFDVLAGGNERLFILAQTDGPTVRAVNAANSALRPLLLDGSDLRFFTAFNERARIDSSGNLLVGTTAIPASSTKGFAVGGDSATGTYIQNRANTTGTWGHIAFYNPNGLVGTISTNGTTTTYATSSDYRLKENIVDAPSASDSIDAIQIRSFDWKADGSHQKYGVIAQELEAIAPEAVSKGDKEDDMWGVDYSKLVPMLIKEVQSLRARVAQLEGE
jgi:hypothetical protein